MKKNKGITLIALVITIVILLILAAVSINAVFGDNGLITKARNAKVLTEYANKRDELSTIMAEEKMNNLLEKTEIKPSKLIEKMKALNESGVFYAKSKVDYSEGKDETYEDTFPTYIIYPDNTKIYINDKFQIIDEQSVMSSGVASNTNPAQTVAPVPTVDSIKVAIETKKVVSYVVSEDSGNKTSGLNDLTGNGNDLTLHNASLNGEGNAIVFNGSSTYGDIDLKSELSQTTTV